MSLKYIRNFYKVPANVGGRVEFNTGKAVLYGTIKDSHGPYLIVKPDDAPEHVDMYLHPTWNIKYIPTEVFSMGAKIVPDLCSVCANNPYETGKLCGHIVPAKS